LILTQIDNGQIKVSNKEGVVGTYNGLVNTGVSCYMNVVFQLLCHLPGIREYFLSSDFAKELNMIHKDKKNDQDTLLVQHFATFIRVYYGIGDRKILDLIELRGWVSEKNSIFSLKTQEDAHEFLLFIVNQMSEEITLPFLERLKISSSQLNSSGFSPLRSQATGNSKPVEENQSRASSPSKLKRKFSTTAAKKSSSRSTANKLREKSKFSEPMSLRGHSDFISSIAGTVAAAVPQFSTIFEDTMMGEVTTEITCDVCSKTSKVCENFFLLELQTPDTASSHLEQCVDNLVKKEVLEEKEGWECENCQAKRKAVKKTTVSKLPPVFILYLNRIRYENMQASKNNCKIDTPNSLDMSKYQTQQPAQPSLYSKLGSIVAYA